MFVPSVYRQPDDSWMVDLIRRHPLALAVINGGDELGPYATHLPVIPDPALNGEWPGELSGALLLGHMNIMNPHWAELETGGVILLVFTGPHAYVSPSLYEMTPAAPTWDFTSVHVRGTVEKIESTEETLHVVRSTALAYETAFGEGWDQSESVGYFRQIVRGVGAFRIRVSGAEGMFKLSQEQPSEIRERVEKSFGGSECTRHRETADLMSRLPD